MRVITLRLWARCVACGATDALAELGCCIIICCAALVAGGGAPVPHPMLCMNCALLFASAAGPDAASPAAPPFFLAALDAPAPPPPPPALPMPSSSSASAPCAPALLSPGCDECVSFFFLLRRFSLLIL